MFGSKRACDLDRKSTRLNSSHLVTSYAVFCLKKKNSTRRRPVLECAVQSRGRDGLPSVSSGWVSESVRAPLDGLRTQIFFFNDTATTEIYTLSLHDALPI